MGSTDISQRSNLNQGLNASQASGKLKIHYYLQKNNVKLFYCGNYNNFHIFFFFTLFNEMIDAKKLNQPFHNKKDDALQPGKMSNIVLSRKSTFERQQDNNSDKVQTLYYSNFTHF